MIDTDVRPANVTERKIAEMLVENTGAQMMDSGGYGRAWQTTRAKYGLDGGLPNSTFSGGPGHTPVEPGIDDIERIARIMRDEPAQGFDRYGDFSVDTFHFLNNALAYEPELDAKWQRYQRVTNFGKDRYDKDWGYQLIPRFLDALKAKGSELGGIYGEGEPVSDNSYNYEHAIDRTIQFTLFTIKTPYPEGHYDDNDQWVDPPYEPFLPDGSYVLLQIHGGADVRGGYTEPVLFSEGEMSEYAILDFGRASIVCEGNPEFLVVGQQGIDGSELNRYDLQHRWDTENGGYSWNLDGMWGLGATEASSDNYPVERDGALKIVIDDEGAHCPVENCGAILR